LPSLVVVVVAVAVVVVPVVIIPFIILNVISVFWLCTAMMGDRQLKCTFADLPDDLSLCGTPPTLQHHHFATFRPSWASPTGFLTACQPVLLSPGFLPVCLSPTSHAHRWFSG